MISYLLLLSFYLFTYMLLYADIKKAKDDTMLLKEDVTRLMIKIDYLYDNKKED